MKRKLILLFSGVGFLIFLDQMTKYMIVKHIAYASSIPVIGDYVRFTFIYNENGVFGLKLHNLMPFISVTVFFSIFSIIAAAIVLFMYFKVKDREWKSEIPLILILGGAAGNFIDRIRLGRVIDFIDCDFPDFVMERFFIYNVADSCITIGVFILIIVSLTTKKDEPTDKPAG